MKSNNSQVVIAWHEQILELTLFTFIANVALERIKLRVEFLELSDGVGALSFVDDEDDKDHSE